VWIPALPIVFLEAQYVTEFAAPIRNLGHRPSLEIPARLQDSSILDVLDHFGAGSHISLVASYVSLRQRTDSTVAPQITSP